MIIRFILRLITFIKYHRILSKVYKEDEIIAKISHGFGLQFKRDWINRIYGVVNPNIRDGQPNPDRVVEYTENGLDSSMWIEKYIMDHMNLMRSFIYTENLFEVLTFSIKPLGNDNYLFVMEPVTWEPLRKTIKWALIEFVILISITIYVYAVI